jgi:uncharacterized protein (TIGR01777 family)
MSRKVLVTGGTGLVGQRLIARLQAAGYDVAILSRSANSGDIKTYVWDINKAYIDPKAFENTDIIVHLAGAGVAESKWTPQRKDLIYNSRVKSTLLLYNYLKDHDHQVKTFVGASAIGLYGADTGSSFIQETAPVGHDFLAHVVDAWETATNKISGLGIRLFQPRIGIVLSNEGGALKELLKPPVAAPLGKGNQYMSWIHIDDLCRMIIYGIEHDQLAGPYNAVGPKPKTNTEFTKVAASVMGKPYLPIPVPKLVLKLMLGEMAQIVLGGSRISAEKIMQAGFQFKFPKLEEALEDLKQA